MNLAKPQTGADQLAPHPHRIELAGDILQLAWPPLCANCGNTASQSVLVRKPFVRTYSDSSPDLHIGAAQVPYCERCIAEHRREPAELPPLRRLIACFSASEMFAAVAMGLFALFWFKEGLAKLMTHPDGAYGVFVSGGFFAVISWSCYRTARRKTEPAVVPAQTAITTAFDFSDDLSGPYEPERRIYAMRNEQFAKAFGELNRGRVWDPKGPVARKANRLFWITAAIAIAFGVAMWLLGFG